MGPRETRNHGHAGACNAGIDAPGHTSTTFLLRTDDICPCHSSCLHDMHRPFHFMGSRDGVLVRVSTRAFVSRDATSPIPSCSTSSTSRPSMSSPRSFVVACVSCMHACMPVCVGWPWST